MLYFSYGSNMSSKRIRQRVPSAEFIAVSTLSMHELRFHKSSKDGSAKCDAFETRDQNSIVIGVVFEVSEPEKLELDRVEGLGFGYDEKIVVVTSTNGESMKASTYYATDIEPSRKPYHWYKEHVVRGAKENGLPAHYVENIATIESVADPKPGRHESEMAIYC
ncbi:MAG: gamma-glutamylcyclotransferase family protein [Pseudomonadales bacterium]